MGTPHDTFFHFTFRHAVHAEPWLRAALPAELVRILRWPTLRPIPERVHGRALRLGFTDVVFSAKYTFVRGRAFVLTEHRSHHDAGLHGTLVRYSVHLAHSLRRDRTTLAAAVIPVVLYHGPGPLVVDEPAIEALVAADPEAASTLHSLQPRLTAIVDDLSLADEAALLARGLTPLGTLTQLSLRCLPGLAPAAVIAAIHRWGGLLRAVDEGDGPPIGRDAIETFGWYVLHVTDVEPEDVHMAIQQHLNRPEERIMTTARRLRLEGMKEGEARGEAHGETKGKAALVHRMLTRRFGPLPATIESRLQAATTAELERWADRLLDATSLDAVFASD